MTARPRRVVPGSSSRLSAWLLVWVRLPVRGHAVGCAPRARPPRARSPARSARQGFGVDTATRCGQVGIEAWQGDPSCPAPCLEYQIESGARPRRAPSLTEDDSAPGGPQTTGRTISGGLRIWRLGVRIPRGALLTSGFPVRARQLVALRARSNLGSYPRSYLCCGGLGPRASKQTPSTQSAWPRNARHC